MFRHASTVLKGIVLKWALKAPFLCACSESVKSCECERFVSNVVVNVLWENGCFPSCCRYSFV